MTATSDHLTTLPERRERTELVVARLRAMRLGWAVPFVKLAAGEEPGEGAQFFWRAVRAAKGNRIDRELFKEPPYLIGFNR